MLLKDVFILYEKYEKENENLVITVDYNNNISMLRHGVSMHWWNSETTSLHSHNFYEFFIVTTGEAVHELNNDSKMLRKGTLQLIKPTDSHRIIASAPRKCTHINISATAEKLESICNALGISTDELISNTKKTISLSVNELELFTKKAERVSLMQFNNDESYHIIICEMIVEIICILYKKITEGHPEYPEWFFDTLDKIHSPKYIACSADDVYAIAGFSPPVVIEHFKKYTGKTVVEYLKSIKMNKACELLRKTDTPIVDISNIFGYTSLSHFNKIFKEYTGITPAVYRKGANKEG